MTLFSLQILVYEWDHFLLAQISINDVIFITKMLTESENFEKIG